MNTQITQINENLHDEEMKNYKKNCAIQIELDGKKKEIKELKKTDKELNDMINKFADDF